MPNINRHVLAAIRRYLELLPVRDQKISAKWSPDELIAVIDEALAPASRPQSRWRFDRAPWRSIKAQIALRSRGRCEACGKRLPKSEAQDDHFFGGSGRRLAMESVETCWHLCVPCHRDKTENRPSAEHWLEKFVAHCEKHGYAQAAEEARKRIDSERLVEEAAKISAGTIGGN